MSPSIALYLILIFLYISVFINCVCDVCVGIRDTFQELVLSFHCLSSGNQIQVTSYGSKHLYH